MLIDTAFPEKPLTPQEIEESHRVWVLDSIEQDSIDKVEVLQRAEEEKKEKAEEMQQETELPAEEVQTSSSEDNSSSNSSSSNSSSSKSISRTCSWCNKEFSGSGYWWNGGMCMESSDLSLDIVNLCSSRCCRESNAKNLPR
jgi:hypothetical protein